MCVTQVNNMALEDCALSGCPEDTLVFALLDKTPLINLKLVCQAQSEEAKQNWMTHLRSLLDMQGDFLRGSGTAMFTNR